MNVFTYFLSGLQAGFTLVFLHPIYMTGECTWFTHLCAGRGPHLERVQCVYGSNSGANSAKKLYLICTWPPAVSRGRSICEPSLNVRRWSGFLIMWPLWLALTVVTWSEACPAGSWSEAVTESLWRQDLLNVIRWAYSQHLRTPYVRWLGTKAYVPCCSIYICVMWSGKG